jgi:hypothetical protein
MVDRLGIIPFPVLVTLPPAATRTQLLQRADVLEREAGHLARAARQIRDGINSNQSRLMADGVLNSRNWMLSVVMSHCFLQSALEGDSLDRSPGALEPRAFWVSEQLVPRAARVGLDDGRPLRRP